MEAGKISTRYARAIYEYALEERKETTLYEGMQSLIKYFTMYPALKKTMNDPTLSSEDKVKLLVTACGISSDKTLQSVIKMIVENGRTAYMERIALMYEKEYRQAKGIIIAQLTTVEFITNDIRKILVKLLSKESKEQVEFITKLDSDIIGGFILKIEDRLLDASVKRQLNRIKCQI